MTKNDYYFKGWDSGYQKGRTDAINDVIAMFKAEFDKQNRINSLAEFDKQNRINSLAEFDKQNRINSLYVPTVVVNENIYIDLEQLKES